MLLIYYEPEGEGKFRPIVSRDAPIMYLRKCVHKIL